jgi:hypothetical protein
LVCDVIRTAVGILARHTHPNGPRDHGSYLVRLRRQVRGVDDDGLCIVALTDNLNVLLKLQTAAIGLCRVEKIGPRLKDDTLSGIVGIVDGRVQFLDVRHVNDPGFLGPN